mmetsp:Transcript_70350/g.205746  ORF Transcript_70350/g.205746 Transcript_70350/m.205746 type:complete len:176 (-) Transcript_70350:87-614(-)
MEVAKLCLGEPLITDLLAPAASVSQRQRAGHVAYMRELVRHMNRTGKPPESERLEVNHLGLVTSGNHRILAAWLLRWRHVNCLRCSHAAGWRVPLLEAQRAPLERLLELSSLLGPGPQLPELREDERPSELIGCQETPLEERQPCDLRGCGEQAACTLICLEAAPCQAKGALWCS